MPGTAKHKPTHTHTHNTSQRTPRKPTQITTPRYVNKPARTAKGIRGIRGIRLNVDSRQKQAEIKKWADAAAEAEAAAAAAEAEEEVAEEVAEAVEKAKSREALQAKP